MAEQRGDLTSEQIATLWDAYWGKSNTEDTWRMAYGFGREAARAEHNAPPPCKHKRTERGSVFTRCLDCDEYWENRF